MMRSTARAAQGSTTAATRLFLMGSTATLPNIVGSGGAVGLVPPSLPPFSGASAGLAPVPGPAVPSGLVADASRGSEGGTAGIQPRAVSFPSAAGGADTGATSPHLARYVAGGLVTLLALARRVGVPGTAAAVFLLLRHQED